ncbi:hypothetical protein PUNSTDRAFT_145550 [Punctularia strigosozonata HHB-11173 SS5]|uniref:uncharacterized protein n=1 Tax=Punctularia strigosozonata (strain HHB-11173) TaxID=741275 RepID=UPI0004417280|nr:uncharacterized protein PUNSTDRAFT_145550 [Punctularia strigosozonata HHB-11173 SS5]EIN06259.1 hypothetical protein PUNSTDRAFT_145550 [Punctularia strigosozonata HHB-11173 SS5]
MTSRLKRKLNDMGIDPASARANESFCLIGTPLPPLEKSKDTGEFVPLWKQEVRDEKGRRRLHGAFTGGYSAGYFNTVGSKEGWTPQTFVSSRSERAKKKQARPEDFMDEEDLAELAESRKLVDETEEMDILGGTQAEMSKRTGDVEDDSMAAKLASTLLPAPKDSAGARILKKMGWRLGQGIGPRLTHRQRMLQDLQFSAGAVTEIPPDAEDDEEAKKHTYAPRDTPLLLTTRKDNTHGLGYSAGMGLNESLGASGSKGPIGPRLSGMPLSLPPSVHKQTPSSAAGFGLGALNDADEDDLDVYDPSGSNRSATRMAYDIADHDDPDRIAIGGRSTRGPTAAPRLQQPVGYQTFRDGRPVLKGFILSDQPVAEDKWFPLPDVPAGWKPDPKRVWTSKWDKENMDDPKKRLADEGPKSHHDWKRGVSADERGALLGETPLPAAPKSVFDFISSKDRDRLKTIASTAHQPSAPVPPPAKPANIQIPHVEPSTAQLALRGFQPYTSDPVRQARYTAFLQSHANSQELTIEPLPGKSAEEFNKELADYAKSAMVFRPLGGAMAGRFTSARAQDLGPKIQEGLFTPKFASGGFEGGAGEQQLSAEEQKQKEEEERKRKEEEEREQNPRAYAARMGMYGPLTREVRPWQPSRLLCKRFGVKDPNPEPVAPEPVPGAPPGTSAGPGSGWDAEAALAEAGKSAEEVSAIMAGAPAKGKGGKRDLANVGLGEDEEQGRDTLTYERPSMDIFKAIFASDEEDSDEEDKAEEEPDQPSVVAVKDAPATQQGFQATPAHPTVSGPTKALYEPKSNGLAPDSALPEKVDLATFKPTFVPRSERETKKSKDRDRKDKRDKKGKGKVLVSFADDEGEDGGLVSSAAPKKEKKKKDKEKGRDKIKEKDRDKEDGRETKKRRHKEEEDDDESMWVEKPPPEVVKALEAGSTHVSKPDVEDGTASRGRKRAADFM